MLLKEVSARGASLRSLSHCIPRVTVPSLRCRPAPCDGSTPLVTMVQSHAQRRSVSVSSASEGSWEETAPDVPSPSSSSPVPDPTTPPAAALPAPPAGVTALLEETTTATAVETTPEPPKHEDDHNGTHHNTFEFACPICHTTTFSINSMPTRSEGLHCSRCSRTFNASSQYLDLTLSSGVKPKVYQRKEWGGTEIFRSPLVSFAYERGWRQGFSWAGFPGVDKEFDMAMDYLRPAYGSVLVDMSCGSGLFSRRFAQSGKFSGVVAADFSESMLQQARAYFKEDGTLGGVTPVTLLRADVGRLPFATGSVAAIHAGAAIHCWPNPQAALAEISRVLKPGGVFVASTFLVTTAPLGQALGNDDLVRPFNQFDMTRTSAYKWWEEEELRDLCTEVGLQNFRRTRQWRFIMFAARKP